MNKGLLWKLFAVVLAVAVVYACFFAGPEHIEDTNGPDDYSLAVLTDADILGKELSARGMGMKTGGFELGGIRLSEGVKFYSKQFTGVEELLWADYILPSDIVIDLRDFVVESGNLKLVVVLEDEIVATLEPGESVYYRLDNVVGHMSLRIAGESAAFHFYMSETDYENFSHY